MGATPDATTVSYTHLDVYKRQRLHREVIDETYPKLHELLRPLSQEDIDLSLIHIQMCIRDSTNRERLREITDGIEQGIKELFESEKYMRYLSVMSMNVIQKTF